MHEANRDAILAVNRREAFRLVAMFGLPKTAEKRNTRESWLFMLSCKALPPSRSSFSCHAPLEVIQSRCGDGRRAADLTMSIE
jgi:hypothetical protein